MPFRHIDLTRTKIEETAEVYIHQVSEKFSVGQFVLLEVPTEDSLFFRATTSYKFTNGVGDPPGLVGVALEDFTGYARAVTFITKGTVYTTLYQADINIPKAGPGYRFSIYDGCLGQLDEGPRLMMDVVELPSAGQPFLGVHFEADYVPRY